MQDSVLQNSVTLILIILITSSYFPLMKQMLFDQEAN